MIYDDKKFIGKKIREYRRRAKLTQEELAEAVGLCDKHIGQIERGAYMPTLVNFFKIIEVLSIDLSEFGIEFKADTINPLKQELIKMIHEVNEKELILYHKLLTGTHEYFNKI